MAKFYFTVSESNITVLVNGAMLQMPKTHMGFAKLAEHLKGKEHDAGYIESLFDKRETVARLTAGQVKVVGTTVYYKGAPVRSKLAEKLIYMLDNGYDATPWAKFMDRIATNPTESAREMLFEFIERWNSPLDSDGRFIAFKGVNNDYTDCHTGTFDNSPGKVVRIDRSKVVEDPNRTCAAGLHVCASHYLDSFWTGKKVIAVAVAPEDVVSVPVDYKFSKMRTCGYEVLGDVEDQRHRGRIETSEVITKSDTGFVKPADKPTTHAAGLLEGEEVSGADGTRYRLVDDWPEDGVFVYHSHKGKLGTLQNLYTVNYSDDEHPENAAWRDGDAAGHEIDDVYIYDIVFEDGESYTFHFRDEDDCPMWPLEGVEDNFCDECGDVIDEDLSMCDECEMAEWEAENAEDEEDDVDEEPLTFLHEATGQTFTATQVTDIVNEIGQRGFHREYGVPRTTVQEWLKAINNQ